MHLVPHQRCSLHHPCLSPAGPGTGPPMAPLISDLQRPQSPLLCQDRALQIHVKQREMRAPSPSTRFHCASYIHLLPFQESHAAVQRSQGRFRPRRSLRGGVGVAPWLLWALELESWVVVLPSAGPWGACEISANSPCALIKPQVADSRSAHVLWPIEC